MDLLIGTKNPAKLSRYLRMLAAYPQISPLSPSDLGLDISIQEEGSAPQANARLKADGYRRARDWPAWGSMRPSIYRLCPLSSSPPFTCAARPVRG
jgi:hypothetical protein